MSPCHLLECGAGSRSGHVQAYSGHDLVRRQATGHPSGGEAVRRHVAAAPRSGHHDPSVHGERDGEPLGGGIGVGEASADRADVADGDVAQHVQGFAQHVAPGGDPVVQLDGPMGDHGADGQAVTGKLVAAERLDSPEIDQHCGPDQAERHQRQQALATCQDLGRIAVLAEE